MKLCIPVTEDKGLDSPVCAHFGSAPLFLVVDTESGVCRAIANRTHHQGHGTCRPMMSLASERVDAIAVGGIGMGALGKLAAAGVRVYVTRELTAGETASSLKAGTLPEATPATACGHHGHGPGNACH
ncbi:MAG: NifB/NifX family molybdenum-iron cluster-binding protein [Thermodesulfobacteriota bacterium]